MGYPIGKRSRKSDYTKTYHYALRQYRSVFSQSVFVERKRCYPRFQLDENCNGCRSPSQQRAIIGMGWKRQASIRRHFGRMGIWSAVNFAKWRSVIECRRNWQVAIRFLKRVGPNSASSIWTSRWAGTKKTQCYALVNTRSSPRNLFL